MPPPKRNDPYQAFNFIVEIDGIAIAGFSEVSGLISETEVIQYREGNEQNSIRKLPGLNKFSNITLKRGCAKDTALWDWRQTVVDGNTKRANGVIILLDEARQPVRRWLFREGWPCKFAGPVLNAASSDIAIETLEIAHEGLELA